MANSLAYNSINLFLFFVVFAYGVIIGSFLNVLIYRLPREIGFVKGFSKCPSCDHRLFAKDLVPLFSYIFLKGKCRYCKTKISIIYPVVELCNGLLWAAVVYKFGFTIEALCFCAIISCLMVVVGTDKSMMIIPDSMPVVIGISGIVLSFVQPSPTLMQRLIGILCVSGIMFLIAVASNGRAMGGGDIKLMAAVGFAFGWKLTLFITFLASILGTLLYFILMIGGKKVDKMVPFGAFLGIAGIIAVFYGDKLIELYLSQFLI